MEYHWKKQSLNLFVHLAKTKCFLSISGRDQLYAQQSHLSGEHGLELHQFENLVIDGDVGLSSDDVNGLLYSFNNRPSQASTLPCDHHNNIFSIIIFKYKQIKHSLLK